VTHNEIIALGYHSPRLLPSGEWAALYKFIFTVGLVVGLNESGYRTRFCYQCHADAFSALAVWDGSGDPPGKWIKQKGEVDRINPRFAGFEIVVDSVQSES
jgi:hypothetical protein